MKQRLSEFERFRLVGEEFTRFSAEFEFIAETGDLSRTPEIARLITSYNKVAGVYFWTAAVKDAEYKLYAGKTNSLGYRLVNYTAPFQPHSPNDFKLLVFRAFLQEVAPESALRVYFKRVAETELTTEENRVIGAYRPLLNIPRPATPEAKRQLQAAFAAYYRSSFEGVLGNAA